MLKTRYVPVDSGVKVSESRKTTLSGGFSVGGDNWNRTSDPLHVKQVL